MKTCSICGSPADLITKDFAPFGLGKKGKVFFYRCQTCGAETRHTVGNNFEVNVLGKIYSEQDAREHAEKQTNFTKR
jgi:DNA-directed RNA polymerase subunit RPC12/RpoP